MGKSEEISRPNSWIWRHPTQKQTTFLGEFVTILQAS